LCLVALAAVGAAVLRLPFLSAILGVLTALVWVAAIREANRLEIGIHAAADQVCSERTTEAGRADGCQTASVSTAGGGSAS
jgi:hypothetical protein